jgi:hypothetical protein
MINRRRFLKLSLSGGLTAFLSPSVFGSPRSQLDVDPHFFLWVTFPVPAGLDSTYLFDARPLEMTARNVVQNYRRNPREPDRWVDRAGNVASYTEIVRPLLRFRKHFSVVNGVTMGIGTLDHLRNFNFLLTGNLEGGDAFVSKLNAGDESGAKVPISAISNRLVTATLPHHGQIIPLDSQRLVFMQRELRQQSLLDAPRDLTHELYSHLRSLGRNQDSFSQGSSEMANGFESAQTLARTLKGMHFQADGSEPGFIRMAGKLFACGALRTAVMVLEPRISGQLDSHDVASQIQNPERYTGLMERVAKIFETLHNTSFDHERSLLDVTTVMVSSEFSRTFRQADKPIDATGTDHNPLSNSILIGGKGIRGGCVIGASDFQTANEKLSGAHLSLDPGKFCAMGRPFDFERGIARTDLPTDFVPADYISNSCLINTVFSLFGVSRERWHRWGAGLPVARIIPGLLA